MFKIKSDHKPAGDQPKAIKELVAGLRKKHRHQTLLGATGTGKSIFLMQFLIDGLEKGEKCLYAGFEESRDQILRNPKCFGWDLENYEKKGLLKIFVCLHILRQLTKNL